MRYGKKEGWDKKGEVMQGFFFYIQQSEELDG
jgi:hypothetical protein